MVSNTIGPRGPCGFESHRRHSGFQSSPELARNAICPLLDGVPREAEWSVTREHDLVLPVWVTLEGGLGPMGLAPVHLDHDALLGIVEIDAVRPDTFLAKRHR